MKNQPPPPHTGLCMLTPCQDKAKPSQNSTKMQTSFVPSQKVMLKKPPTFCVAKVRPIPVKNSDRKRDQFPGWEDQGRGPDLSDNVTFCHPALGAGNWPQLIHKQTLPKPFEWTSGRSFGLEKPNWPETGSDCLTAETQELGMSWGPDWSHEYRGAWSGGSKATPFNSLQDSCGHCFLDFPGRIMVKLNWLLNIYHKRLLTLSHKRLLAISHNWRNRLSHKTNLIAVIFRTSDKFESHWNSLSTYHNTGRRDEIGVKSYWYSVK